MAPRMARNNGDGTLLTPDLDVVLDWNGYSIPPGAIRVVDDENALVLATVTAGTLEFDPTIGRHYLAPPTEREIRPTEGAPPDAGPRPRQ
jgi:hypothetical protein